MIYKQETYVEIYWLVRLTEIINARSHTLSRTALASIPNLSAIGTMRSGRLKTSLRNSLERQECTQIQSRESTTNTVRAIPKDTMSPQCQCRQPCHSPHACGLEAALHEWEISIIASMEVGCHWQNFKCDRWTWVVTQRVWASWVFPELQENVDDTTLLEVESGSDLRNSYK
jgi:hypothetical protein